MIGPTHLALGFLAGVAVTPTLPPYLRFGAGILCAVAALMPDRAELGLLPHRTLTHTFFVPLALLAIPHPIAHLAALGVLTHIIADCLTPVGVPVLWPLPLRLRIPLVVTGGDLDYLIGAVAMAVAGWLLLSPLDWQPVLTMLSQMMDHGDCGGLCI